MLNTQVKPLLTFVFEDSNSYNKCECRHRQHCRQQHQLPFQRRPMEAKSGHNTGTKCAISIPLLNQPPLPEQWLAIKCFSPRFRRSIANLFLAYRPLSRANMHKYTRTRNPTSVFKQNLQGKANVCCHAQI
jgi:hypothetical protein